MTAAPTYCSVAIEGEEMADLAIDIRVEEGDGVVDVARVRFGDAALILSDILHEGLSIVIDLGRSDEHAVIFRGVVTGVVADYPATGSPSVEVVAHDRLILLGLTPRTRAFGNTSVGQIAQRIAVDNELVPGRIELDDDALFPADRPAQQVAETDLAFLRRLASDHGARLYLDHSEAVDRLCLVASSSIAGAQPLDAPLVFNRTLADFRASFDAWATDPAERLVTAGVVDGERVELTAQLTDGTGDDWRADPERIARLGAGAERIGRLAARSEVVRQDLSRYHRTPARIAGAPAREEGERGRVHGDPLRARGQTGRGRTGGSIWLRPRTRVRIEGYGGRWSGVWNLSRVSHAIDLARRRYETAFTCVR